MKITQTVPRKTLVRHRNKFTDVTRPTIRRAFDRQETVLVKESGWLSRQNSDSALNLTDVYSRIIRDSGRISETYNSDILYDIEAIKDAVHELRQVTENTTKIICIGLRKYGADSTESIMQVLLNGMDYMSGFVFADRTYAHVLAIEIEAMVKGPHPEDEAINGVKMTVTMKDIINDLYKMDPEDVDGETRFKSEDRPVKVFTPEEIDGFVRKAYDAYQYHWLQQNGVSVEDAMVYARDNPDETDLAGLSVRNGHKPDDFEKFRAQTLLNEEYMKMVLQQAAFTDYLLIMDQVYAHG